MKRHFYYLECEVQPKLFKHLDAQVEEGFITYVKNEQEGIIIISNLELEEEDDLFKKLLKWDLIEDYDMDYDDDGGDDDYSDFHNDYEDN